MVVAQNHVAAISKFSEDVRIAQVQYPLELHGNLVHNALASDFNRLRGQDMFEFLARLRRWRVLTTNSA